MFIVQRFVGYALLTLGFLITIASFGDGTNFSSGLLMLFAGFVLVSLSELIHMARATYHASLGLPPSRVHLHDIIKRSPKFLISSQSLNIRKQDALESTVEYPIVRLNDEAYMRAKVFLQYMTQKESEYSFHFPNTKQIVITCASNYSSGVKLFRYNDHVYVKLSELPLTYSEDGDQIVVEVIPVVSEETTS